MSNKNTTIDLQALRTNLHARPEVSGNETETAATIADILSQLAPDALYTNVGGNGVVAVFGQAENGKTIMVRCELDALPIQEINTFAHKSVFEGVSHKCGHDGHMAILIGLAEELSINKPENCRVVLLFQPAEENGEGAKAVLEDERFLKLSPDFVVALHNIPGEEKSTILCKEDSFTASVRSMIIKLNGKTAHAGEPDKGINPALAIAEILQEALKLNEPIAAENFKQVTPIQVEMGEEAFGISAGYGEVKLTIRTWQDRFMEELVADLKSLVTRVAKENNLQLEISWTQFFAANQNHHKVVKTIALAAKENNLTYKQKETPFRWGEDFGLFTAKYPGAMFGLGAGKNQPALHNPDYDFPDEITASGVAMFLSIIKNLA